jgi:DNA-binding NtrC family response regulator
VQFRLNGLDADNRVRDRPRRRRCQATDMPLSISDTRAPLEVLIVDDEPDIRDLLAEYFRERRYDVTLAADGRAAVAAIERAPARFGLILTDLNLPGVDGLGVLSAARAANPSCYVVIITGFASLDSAIQAVRLGAYDYLTKPFSLGQIEVVVRRIIDRLTLDAENRQLTRQVGSRGNLEPSGAIQMRLDAIDARLERIEGAVQNLLHRRRAGET